MRFAGLVVVAAALAGCSSVDGFLRDLNPPIVRFEVWNRTLDDVVLTDGDGANLEVPACDHAVADAFRVDQVRVHTKVGYVWGFGSGGDSATGRQYLVIVAADGESFPTPVMPIVLPACLGHPNAQPGVFIDP